MNSYCAEVRMETPAQPPVPLATLASGQARVLDEMLSGASLRQVLGTVAEALETVAGPGAHSVVMLGDDRLHLACVASPSLASGHCPDWLALAVPDQVMAPEIWVLDIEALPVGLPWREATLRQQLRAFWSVPIQGGGGRLLGTPDTYWPKPLLPRPELPPDASPAHAVAARLLARTAALAIAHEHMGRRMATLEARQADMPFLNRADELTALTRHLQRMQEEDRSRLARELHDRLGAFFTATKFDMARLKSALGPVTPEVAVRLAHFTDMLDKGIALKRRMIEELRPSALSSLGLIQALEILLNEFTRTHGVPHGLLVHAALEPVQLPANVQLTLYRLVQEALLNVAAYAQATEVKVWLKQRDEGGVEIGVSDNGVGFDIQKGRIAMLGLLGMHYRVQAQGGEFSVQSSPACGATVGAIFPKECTE